MLINIFDENLSTNAQMHCDSHVNKLILESVQILCTVGHKHGVDMFYRPTHENHPLVKWAESSAGNMFFVMQYANKLYLEKLYRTGKYHKSGLLLIENIDKFITIATGLPETIAKPDFSTFPKPKGYEELSLCESYRRYFCERKSYLAKWTNRPAPDWFKSYYKKHEEDYPHAI